MINVVYATATVMVPLPNGSRYMVREGSHWLADDPVVLAHPGIFSEDPQVGLNYSVRPPAPVETASATPGEKRQRPVPGPGPRRGE